MAVHITRVHGQQALTCVYLMIQGRHRGRLADVTP
jgi:hypothetical protein